MLVSAELRWFWRDTLPPKLEPWFRSGALAPGGGNFRDDEYLVDSAQCELGIKKRSGKSGIEIKGLVEIRPAVPEPFSCRIEIFTKWTSHTLAIDHLPRIVVRKQRWLRKYDTSGPEVRELELDTEERLRDRAESLPEHGCHIELVGLTVGDDGVRWWTFGLEAFGSLQSVEESLYRTIAYVVPIDQEVLAGGMQMSYPKWLSSITPRT